LSSVNSSAEPVRESYSDSGGLEENILRNHRLARLILAEEQLKKKYGDRSPPREPAGVDILQSTISESILSDLYSHMLDNQSTHQSPKGIEGSHLAAHDSGDK